MRYITIAELGLLDLAAYAVLDDCWDEEYQRELELKIGDTVDLIICDGVWTLKYSNVLLIGVKPI